MDNHNHNFRAASSAAMQRAVYAGQMSVADYYERQVRVDLLFAVCDFIRHLSSAGRFEGR